MKRYLFATSAILATVLSLGTGRTAAAKPADLPSNNQIECPDGSDDPVQAPRYSIEVNLDLLSSRITVKVGVAPAKPEAPTNLDAFAPGYFKQWFAHVGEAVAAANRQRIAAVAAEQEARTRTLETRVFDRVTVRTEQVPLRQAIKNLASASGLPIAVDYQALRDANINLDVPVSLKVKDASVHRALCQFLDEIDLTYVIEDGLVKVTTKACGQGKGSEREAAANEAQAQQIFEIAERCRRAGDFDRARICYQRVHRLTPTSLHGRVAITRLIAIEDRLSDAAEEQNIPGRTDDPDESN